ncbi:MAG: serine/threonine-protein kinase [Polyangiaceae bacterium]
MTGPSSTPLAQTPQPRLLGGRFELGEELGRGGMARVFLGRDTALDREVAIKLLTDPADRDRFLSEARKTAKLSHPNVVTVLEVGEDGSESFIVMERLRGETLEDRLAREGRVPLATALGLAADISAGLAASHALGIIHRDVKPANIFVTGSQAHPLVKLIDFGIAKRIDANTVETDPGVLVGTLTYMAPEQIRGEALDGRADLYALGITLYRMLSGVVPFVRDTAASMIHAHLLVEPPPLPHVADATPAQEARVAALLEMLLAKEKAARPRDADDARRRLLEVLEEPPASSAAPSAPSAQPTVAGELELALAPAPLASASATEDAAAARLEVDFGPPQTPAQPSHAPMSPAVTSPSYGAPSYGAPSYGAPSYGAPLAPWNPPSPPAREPPAERGLMASLATIPTGISKRVAGYSLFVFLVLGVFFRTSWFVLGGFATLAALGLVAYIAAAQRRP